MTGVQCWTTQLTDDMTYYIVTITQCSFLGQYRTHIHYQYRIGVCQLIIWRRKHSKKWLVLISPDHIVTCSSLETCVWSHSELWVFLMFSRLFLSLSLCLSILPATQTQAQKLAHISSQPNKILDYTVFALDRLFCCLPSKMITNTPQNPSTASA